MKIYNERFEGILATNQTGVASAWMDYADVALSKAMEVKDGCLCPDGISLVGYADVHGNSHIFLDVKEDRVSESCNQFSIEIGEITNDKLLELMEEHGRDYSEKIADMILDELKGQEVLISFKNVDRDDVVRSVEHACENVDTHYNEGRFMNRLENIDIEEALEDFDVSDVNVRAGYYEFNLYVNDTFITSLGDLTDTLYYAGVDEIPVVDDKKRSTGAFLSYCEETAEIVKEQLEEKDIYLADENVDKLGKGIAISLATIEDIELTKDEKKELGMKEKGKGEKER